MTERDVDQRAAHERRVDQRVADEGLWFGPDFLFGVATAAYQIEGAVAEDGRGPSVWDTFSGIPGKTKNGDTGQMACDSYHRYGEDVRLMADLGVGGYRFSVAWPRVQPTGRGSPQQAGLDYYSRLVDALLERGIAACPTLFHWDLPQALEDAGGWLARDTAARFAEYAGQVAAAIGDRVRMWITVNEPVAVTSLGYALGVHAPGRTLLGDAFPAAHHQLLGHGLASAALRAARPGVPVGITHNLAPVRAASTDPADRTAARIYDGLRNRLYTDPVLLARYPDDLGELFPAADAAVVADDLATIGAPLDFLGVNYYNPELVGAPGAGNPLGFELLPWPDAPRTAFDWPVVPDGLYEVLVGLRERYAARLPPVYVTENGAAYDDLPSPDGSVLDQDRIDYLDAHLRALRRAMDAGVDVRGYFCWSLLDNFEWAEGYSKRFGLVYLDYPSQRRTPKASFGWYRRLIAGQHRPAQR